MRGSVQMIIKLPLEIEKVAVVTECWLFNRLAVIQASRYAEDWIASHYNLFMSPEGNFMFGDMEIDLPSYHDEILQRNQIRLCTLSKENIVDTLRDNIRNTRYIVMFIKVNEKRYHEVLLYGFNDEAQAFETVGLSQYRFGAAQIPYTYMEETIEDIKRHLYYEYESIDISSRFQFYVTAFSIQPKYVTDGCVFGAYEKIRHEVCGKIIQSQTVSRYNDSAAESQTLYTGIACLRGLEELLNTELHHGEFHSVFRGLVNNAHAIYEHRSMLYQSMQYICKKWNIDLQNQAYPSMNEYRACCERTQKWMNMTIKYEQTKDPEPLRSIAKEIPEAYDEEYQCLERFLETAEAWFLGHEGLK